MAKLSNFYYLTVFSVLYVQVIYCALDLSKVCSAFWLNFIEK